MEEKLVMDKQRFKIFASDTKRGILKELEKSQLTLTDISRLLKMSPSTVKEHMNELASAGLVIQKDEGRKWKYYELTRTGKQFTSPSEKRIFFMMGLSLLVAAASSWQLIEKLSPQATRFSVQAMESSKAPLLASPGAVDIANTAAVSIPYLEIGIFGLSLLVLGMSIGYLIIIRKRP